MAWNPFRAIGNAINSVFGREERATSQPERAERSQETRERGFLGRIVDRVTGAERSERERQLEERERQLEAREKQLEKRERAVAQPTTAAPTGTASNDSGSTTTAAPTPEAPPNRELPKFSGGGASDFVERDERAFGTDNDIVRDLQEAVDNFIMDRGGLDDLGVDARDWLENPTISEIFNKYWQSGGFTADQVMAGMTEISNIEISVGEDGKIHVEFDYVSEIDREDLDGEDEDHGDYVVSGHAG